jgi:hypothetical protein
MGLLSCSEDNLEKKQSRRLLSVRPNDTVEVRREEEIRSTLDVNGSLDGLPFMPEMKKYCGRRFRVLTRVDRAVVEGIGNRRMQNTVILEGATCDGCAHGDCQRTCQILWKEDWLRRVDRKALRPVLDLPRGFPEEGSKENCVGRAFSCQLTSLPDASYRLPASFEDIVRQYLCSRNFAKSGILRHACDFLLWLNFKVQRFLGRKRYASLYGKLRRTPAVSLRLQPGELVEVKSKQEILETLDIRGRNRGLSLTYDMLKYCGGRHRVMRRVDRMISERTKQMRRISDTVILEVVTCDGSDAWNCPRKCYFLWREIWLKRV